MPLFKSLTAVIGLLNIGRLGHKHHFEFRKGGDQSQWHASEPPKAGCLIVVKKRQPLWSPLMSVDSKVDTSLSPIELQVGHFELERELERLPGLSDKSNEGVGKFRFFPSDSLRQWTAVFITQQLMHHDNAIIWLANHFEDFIAGHFRNHGRKILVACRAYTQGAQVGCVVGNGVQDVDQGDKSSSSAFKKTLSTLFEQLLVEFTVKGADCDIFLVEKVENGAAVAKGGSAASSNGHY
ncbi:hypothetical protein M5K25_008306 [Dendrobium thyrsiflorum]|uniref:Uncharacterized protein n=1 Tax=Dendrobium thyrsiflorum TaxID=117978 RepID=A0ABD0V8D9_DENTH